MATRRQPERRAEIKFRLVRGLYECGLTRAQLVGLFRLLDWILALPAPLEYNFDQSLARWEKEKNMPYIMRAEKNGIERGRQEARQEVQDVILARHRQRWGELDAAGRARLDKVSDLSRLAGLLADLMTAESSAEWLKAL